MKVLLINIEHSYGGGANTVYLNIGEMLRRHGVGVVFFALHSTNELRCEQSSFFGKGISQENPISYLYNRFYNRDAAISLQRLIDAEHPDVASIHLMFGGLAPSILKVLKQNKIPIVHTVHDYAMICSKVTLRGAQGEICEKCKGGDYFQGVISKCHHGSFVRSLLATLEIQYHNKRYHPTHYIDHFLFVSHFCANKHEEMDCRFTDVSKSVLYNVPDERVVKLARETVLDTYRGYYLYYGRLSYEKGLHTLIKAFVERPQLKLKIVGTGPLEQQLKDYCRDLGSKNIEFLGFKTGYDLYRIVQEAKFVCVPSEWYENNPMTIIESYTLSTPVIAARIGGIPEIVNDKETGFLFNPGQVDDLLKVLDASVSLLESDYCVMKRVAADFSSLTFDRKNYIDRILNIFKRVINDNQ